MSKLFRAPRIDRPLQVFLFLLLACCFSSHAAAGDQPNANNSFTFEELTALYENETLPEQIEEKLNRLLTTPFLDNSHHDQTPLRFSQSQNSVSLFGSPTGISSAEPNTMRLKLFSAMKRSWRKCWIRRSFHPAVKPITK